MTSGSKYSKNTWYLIILLIIFGIIGGVVGDIVGNNVKALAFLKNNIPIGLTKPLSLDLKLIFITFGISFNVNILSLVGLLIGFFVYRKL